MYILKFFITKKKFRKHPKSFIPNQHTALPQHHKDTIQQPHITKPAESPLRHPHMQMDAFASEQFDSVSEAEPISFAAVRTQNAMFGQQYQQLRFRCNGLVVNIAIVSR